MSETTSSAFVWPNTAGNVLHPADLARCLADLVVKGIGYKVIAQQTTLSIKHIRNLVRAHNNLCAPVKKVWFVKNVPLSKIFNWAAFKEKRQLKALHEWEKGPCRKRKSKLPSGEVVSRITELTRHPFFFSKLSPAQVLIMSSKNQSVNFNEEFLVALLRWLTEPGFPLRWAASKGITTFALDHLDLCGIAYAELGDVKKACAYVRQGQDGVLVGGEVI